eukprot:5390473-Karenia_brevis.AAC.1
MSFLKFTVTRTLKTPTRAASVRPHILPPVLWLRVTWLASIIDTTTARCRPFMHAMRMWDAETSISTEGSIPDRLSASDAQ